MSIFHDIDKVMIRYALRNRRAPDTLLVPREVWGKMVYESIAENWQRDDGPKASDEYKGMKIYVIEGSVVEVAFVGRK